MKKMSVPETTVLYRRYIEQMAAGGSPVLRTEGLGITFGGLKAVQDFNIEVYPGELLGIIGPNGAGKTTVFNLLTGVYRPSEGAIYIGDRLMNGSPPHRFVEMGIARTFQNIRLFSSMTVLENVMVAIRDHSYSLVSALLGLPQCARGEGELRRRAMELLEIFDLGDKRDTVAGSLPYGRQRMLEIARALATGMKVLLLDEPAAGMNPVETQELLRYIGRISREFRVAILLIEHDMSLVMNVCRRIQVINFGETIALGLPEEIACNKQVIRAYLGGDLAGGK